MFRSPVPSVNCKLFNFSECYISIHVPIAGNDTALQDAVYNKDKLDDERLDDGSTDIDSLDAFEYTYERDMKKYLE